MTTNNLETITENLYVIHNNALNSSFNLNCYQHCCENLNEEKNSILNNNFSTDFQLRYEKIKQFSLHQKKCASFLKIAKLYREAIRIEPELHFFYREINFINKLIKKNVKLLNSNCEKSCEILSIKPKLIKICDEEIDEFINIKNF